MAHTFSFAALIRSALPYVALIGAALGLSWLVSTSAAVAEVFHTAPEGLYLTIGILFFLGFVLDTVAPRTAIPSFVWAIFFGMALQPIFSIFTQHPTVLAFLVQLLAAIVLFGGGVEVPFRNFKRYFGPIASLALLGTLFTAFGFAVGLEHLARLFDVAIPAVTIVILAAILASIDPTAIIPALQSLSFKRPFIRDIAIAESALNDVAGSILTRFFIVSLLAGAAQYTASYQPFGLVFDRDTADTLALEIVWGTLVGIAAAWFLDMWQRQLAARGRSVTLDPALFFAVPIIAFAAGSLIGGSGFLSAFVAGLLFDAAHPSKEARHFFEVFVDKFIKPVIFILLGALVPLPTLIAVAPLGIAAGLFFVFVVRPLVVFFTLAPWSWTRKAIFSWRELTFLSFVRETGAIPAVLLLVALASGIPEANIMFAIGMWVILLTLTLEPPLTPWLARTLNLTRIQQ